MRTKRLIALLLSIVVFAVLALTNVPVEPVPPPPAVITEKSPAIDALSALPVKGRAAKTGYARTQFGDGWQIINGCDTRQIILYRDLKEVTFVDECRIATGVLADPYTGTAITYSSEDGAAVQIDHVVALSDAWQKGAQALSVDQREQLANDPLELLAVDGPANQEKGDADAASWLPPNKSFRCDYVARQIAIKKKYALWVTQSEHDAMLRVLEGCPGAVLP